MGIPLQGVVTHAHLNKLQSTTSERIGNLENQAVIFSRLNLNSEEVVTVASNDRVNLLPKNSANGQLDVQIRGFTAKNLVLNGAFSNTAGWSKTVLGFNISALNNELVFSVIDPVINSGVYQSISAIAGHKYHVKALFFPKYSQEITISVGGSSVLRVDPIINEWNILSGVVTTLTNGSFILTHDTTNYSLGDTFRIKSVFCIDLTATFGVGKEPSKEECDIIFSDWFDGKQGARSTRVKSVSADATQESSAYVNLFQVLKSLPNGLYDEVDIGRNMLVKKISEVTLLDSSIYDYVTTNETYDTIRLWKPNEYRNTTISFIMSIDIPFLTFNTTANVNLISINVAKNTYSDTSSVRLALTGTRLTYQALISEEIPIEIIGKLYSYPSGTVYFNNVIGDIDFYGGGIVIDGETFSDIEKVTRVDLESGIETDITDTCTLNEAKNGFTSTILNTNDLVWYDLIIAPNTAINGKNQYSYYDSRYAVVDDTNGKTYRWKVVSTNGVPSITMEEIL